MKKEKELINELVIVVRSLMIAIENAGDYNSECQDAICAGERIIRKVENLK